MLAGHGPHCAWQQKKKKKKKKSSRDIGADGLDADGDARVDVAVARAEPRAHGVPGLAGFGLIQKLVSCQIFGTATW